MKFHVRWDRLVPGIKIQHLFTPPHKNPSAFIPSWVSVTWLYFDTVFTQWKYYTVAYVIYNVTHYIIF